MTTPIASAAARAATEAAQPTSLSSLADISRLLVLNTDSYKTSHFLQYPPGTSHVFS
jgi:hypothetical protein